MTKPANYLDAAIVSVADMEQSRNFYRDTIGLQELDRTNGSGSALAAYWGCSPDVEVTSCLLGLPEVSVGRVLLVDFAGADKTPLRRDGEGMIRGHWNLNFYVDDIFDMSRRLSAAGFHFWTEPVRHELSARTGAPIEVIFEAPDGVVINLVQPTQSQGSFVNEVYEQWKAQPSSPTGFSPVATTAQCVRDMEASIRFYRDALGHRIVIDEVLGSPEANRFLRRPPEGRSRTVFLSSGHVFGKVALNQPQNFPVVERVDQARAPAVGYLAQRFRTRNLEAAVDAAYSCGARTLARSVTGHLPGAVGRPAHLLTNPGSGALVELIEAEDGSD